MGRIGAEGFAQAVEEGDTTLAATLVWQLQSNHFPPVSIAFVPVCIDAIERASVGDWNARIQLPNGRTLTVAGIIEGLHLEAFIDSGGEEEESEGTMGVCNNCGSFLLAMPVCNDCSDNVCCSRCEREHRKAMGH